MRGHDVTKRSRWHGEPAGLWLQESSPLNQIVPWKRWEWLVALGLFVLAVSTRWPVRVSSLEEFDSANYALALREFNIERHQPHPPGYLFFIGAARFAQLWIPDPIQALTAVQVMSGALSLMLFYGLLRLCMPPAWALGSTLLVTFSAQVWFQHVRPMEDAYAFMWMLAVVYALVRSLGSDIRWWIGGMLGLGLAMGAKQLLPVFLVGLLVRTLWDHIRNKRFGTILLGLLGGGTLILTWFIPLSLHMGGARAYAAAALSQLASQQAHMAPVFHMVPSRIYSQLQATFVLIWGPKDLALPMWGLVALGAWQVFTRYVSLRWLLWLVIPTLLIRLLYLGYWPRFTLYYLPFLISLAVVGFYTLVYAFLCVIRRIRPSFAQSAYTAVPYPSPLWFMIPGMVLLSGWIAIQARYIAPTLRIMHNEPSPLVQAMQLIRQHYEPATTNIVTDDELIWRQLDYYAADAGSFRILGPHLNGRNLDLFFQGVRHTLKIQDKPFPPASSSHLGTWTLIVRHWEDLSPLDAFLHVTLYELQGPVAIFRGWHGTEIESTRIVRWSKPEGSQIRLFRVPPHGCSIRLQGVIPTPANSPSPAPVTISINGEPVYTGQEERIDAPLHVQPTEITGNQAVIDILPGCAFIPAQIEKSSGDHRHLGCFRLTDLIIQP
jgi:hypothetical protein